MRKTTVYVLLVITLFSMICSFASNQTPNPALTPRPQAQRTTNVTITPRIPKIRRVPDIIVLERADCLYRNENDQYLTLVGQIEFTKGGLKMYTDSAHYYEEGGSFNAFGNVRIEQGDTLFIYADELNYDSPKEVAYLFGFNGKPVRLINRNVKLETDIFTYNMSRDLGYYTNGGVLNDGQNTLTSVRGQYSPSTKQAQFNDNVVLISNRPGDKLTLENSALYYNTGTHIAQFNVPTIIKNKDGVINSRSGIYNTNTRIAQLFDHSKITTTNGYTLEGDTLQYERNKGIGQAWGNMVLFDPEHHVELRGNYGFYNELTDSAFVTGRAIATEFSKEDTLYLHGRYLKSIRHIEKVTKIISSDTTYVEVPVTVTDSLGNEVTEIQLQPKINNKTRTYNDTTHVLTAWPRVRVYRRDVQAVCDSLVYTQQDSMLRLFDHPVVWSDDRQIFGNRIELHLRDSTVESAVLPDFGFLTQHLEDNYFNQITGKSMTAWFDEDGELYRTLVEGNVEGIVYPEENDSTINKLVNFQTSNLEGFFEKREMVRMKLWNETNGEVIPLYLAKYSDLLLPQFKWYEALRPTWPGSVFIIPDEMEEMMSDLEPKKPMLIPRPKSIRK